MLMRYRAACFLIAILPGLPACDDRNGQSVATQEVLVDCARPVDTTDGRVTGRQVGSDTCTYQGIPFAAPPVGEARWTAPRRPQAYGTLDASTYRPDCPQVGLEFLAPAGGDEACLHLNVWRPAVDRGEGIADLPVMVFIYGGGFQIGGGSWFLYEGSDLTRHGVVVVTINYRLGPLGYMPLPELAAEDPDGSTGAYGTLDQVAALEWVQANIRAFGGDPDNVTVFGESAGAMSTCQMVSSPLAAGLFRRAIMESGNCIVGDLETSYAKAASFTSEAGCDPTSPTVLDCMREATPDELWSAVTLDTAFAFWPHVDGYVLPGQPTARIAAGKANAVDLIAGYNNEEFTLVKVLPVFSRTRNQGWEAFWRRVGLVFTDDEVATIRAAYDETAYATPVELWFDVLEDLLFTCDSMAAVRALGERNNTYMYNFAVDPGAYDIEPATGSFHSLELSFVFGNYEFLQLFFHNEDAAARIVAQSERMQRYWTRFARSGDPNGGDDPRWPLFADGETTLQLDESPEAAPGLKVDACAFWNARLPTDNDGLFGYMADLARGIGFYDEDRVDVDLPF